MDEKTALDLLGLVHGASKSEIKLALSRKQLDYHPDRSAGASPALVELAAEQFRKVTAAAETLLSGNFEAEQSQSESKPSAPADDVGDMPVIVAIRIAFNNNHMALVIELGEQLLKRTKSRTERQETRILLAVAYFNFGQIGEALQHSKDASLEDETNQEAWQLQARAYVILEKWRAARDAVQNALKYIYVVKATMEEIRRLRALLERDRDDIDLKIIESMSLTKRLDLGTDGKCLICLSTLGFKNGRCKNCGYKSAMRAAAKAVGEFIFKAGADVQPDKGKVPFSEDEYCPRCRSGTSYRRGRCGACGYPESQKGTTKSNDECCPNCGSNYSYQSGHCKTCNYPSSRPSPTKHKSSGAKAKKPNASTVLPSSLENQSQKNQLHFGWQPWLALALGGLSVALPIIGLSPATISYIWFAILGTITGMVASYWGLHIAKSLPSKWAKELGVATIILGVIAQLSFCPVIPFFMAFFWRNELDRGN